MIDDEHKPNKTKKNQGALHFDREKLQELSSLLSSTPSHSYPNRSFPSSTFQKTTISTKNSSYENAESSKLVTATDAIERALEKFGVLSPSSPNTKTWKRTLPSSLYSISKIPPLQTLVPLSSLPPVHRQKYYYNIKNKNSHEKQEENDEEIVVEIPTSILLPSDGTNDSSSSSTSHRPLTGNLSGKLTEYTRGQVGRRRPFKAGGMDSNEESSINVGKSQEEQELEQLEILKKARNSRKALELGGLEAYKKGLLIMAPPGVSFDCGISVKNIYGEEAEHSINTCKSGENNVSRKEDEHVDSPTMNLTENTNETRMETAGMWDQSYFDDDSLFGSTSSDTEDDIEDDIQDDIQDDIENEDNSYTFPDNDKDETVAERKNSTDMTKPINTQLTLNQQTGNKSDNEEDIDALLDELTNPQASSQSKKHNMNPLLRQTSSSKAIAKKSWAVTKSLDVSNFHTLIPNPALTFPFELDDFQKQAVARLERKECVFLAAHTSAGKTVCAEYAIALARKHCTRAIYTSPIKALSNQKYRDFKVKFGDDVGLITGDLQIGADSTCLIMTTEILRSMLYRGADLVRDIEWVIFDEVHYINDSERGVVWEEVIIMLPDYVNLIFLSATTPNTIEFSDWIGRTKHKPVHVIRTNYRPVPLSHHLYAGNKLFKILEAQSTFIEKGHRDATKALLPASAKDDKNKQQKGKRGQPQQQKSMSYKTQGSKHAAWQQQGNKQNWTSLVKFLDRENLTPTVIFSFSKKKCEEIAYMLRSLDLNTATERKAAHSFGLQTMSRLSASDASLPQVLATVEMVKRGIGVHHGGLLPILKEMVEILFSRNLIKVLFATETFAMGVNMPTRAVVFNSIRKHDGQQFRELEPGEYTQMAGRAGRRGLDKVGTVIICCFGETPPPSPILKRMLTGSSTKLSSQFRLTYNMILNLLRVEDMSVEGMIKRSFSEFATQRALTINEYPKLLARGTKTLAKLDDQFEKDKVFRVGVDDLDEYYSACNELMILNSKLLTYLLSSSMSGTGGGVLVPGRMLLVTAARKRGYVRTPAIVLRGPMLASDKSNSSANENLVSQSESLKCSQKMVCMVLLPKSYDPSTTVQDTLKSEGKIGEINYCGCVKSRYYVLHEIELYEILMISSKKHKFDYKTLFAEESTRNSGPSRSNTSRRITPDDTFARFQSIGTKSNTQEMLHPFAGIKRRGKKGDFTHDSPATSTRSFVEESTMEILLNAEQQVSNKEFPIVDLKECAKGIHQGTSTFQFRSFCDLMEHLTQQVQAMSSHCHPNIEQYYSTMERKEMLRVTVEKLKHILSNESLRLFPDFLQRKAVLRTLGYVDEQDTVCVKGRVACEVNTCEELIVTEMVLEGVLNDLQPAEIVAALSSLIFQEKSDNELDSELPERLVTCCERMRKIAVHLGQLQNDHELMIDPLEYCDGALKFGLVHVVYEWALGVPFSNICELTTVQEGSIVRCITRLDELCREVRNCARVVGNPTLYRKMEAASAAIKRDIVFASSLYVN